MRHPWDPSRPLVDLDVALVLTPALLLGVSAGEGRVGGVLGRKAVGQVFQGRCSRVQRRCSRCAMGTRAAWTMRAYVDAADVCA